MTIRNSFPLVLALSGLAFGCQDAAKPVSEAPAVKAPLKVKEEPTALTAVVPAQPSSVIDRPKAGETQAVETKVEAPKAEQQALEIVHQAEPDFDRPVDAKDVVVDRFVLAKDVAGREPVEESDHFSPDTQQIFAFVQLANSDAPYAFTVHFEPVDGPSALYGVKLDVPTAPRWRTWAWTKLVHEPGKYRAVLRTLEGEEITSREFTIDEE